MGNLLHKIRFLLMLQNTIGQVRLLAGMYGIATHTSLLNSALVRLAWFIDCCTVALSLRNNCCSTGSDLAEIVVTCSVVRVVTVRRVVWARMENGLEVEAIAFAMATVWVVLERQE